jgi:hypothetical protein
MILSPASATRAIIVCLLKRGGSLWFGRSKENLSRLVDAEFLGDTRRPTWISPAGDTKGSFNDPRSPSTHIILLDKPCEHEFGNILP